MDNFWEAIMSVEDKQKDYWDKASVVADFLKIFAIVIVGVVINFTLKTSELNVQYVKIATDILRAKPDSGTKPLREWAVKVLSEKSDIPLSEEAITDLLDKKLPTGKIWLDSELWDDKAMWEE